MLHTGPRETRSGGVAAPLTLVHSRDVDPVRVGGCPGEDEAVVVVDAPFRRRRHQFGHHRIAVGVCRVDGDP